MFSSACRRASFANVAGVGLDAAVLDWASRVLAAGGTFSGATLSALATFSISAKAAGYWDKLNRINMFCGNQLAAALVPLKVGDGSATDTNVNFVGGDYTEATGLTGNGSTKYLNTGLIPSASLTADNTHLAIYNRAGSAVGGGFLGARVGTDVFEIAGPYNDGNAYSVQYSAAAQPSVAISTPYRLVIGTKAAAGVHTIYKDGASVATSAANAGTLANINVGIFVFAENNGGAPINHTAHPLAAYSIGSGLSAADVTAYNTHMQAFQTALSRNV